MKTKEINFLLDDKDILKDAIMSQKYMLERYNIAAYDSDDTEVKEAFINLLIDEHQLESDLLKEMQKREWCHPFKAEDGFIKRVKEKYENNE